MRVSTMLLRRAVPARGLLAAAAVAALLATTLLTGLVRYAQVLPDAGTRAAVRNRPASQRSVLVSGTAADLGADAAVRQRFAHGLGGLPVTVSGGGYAVGQQLPDGFGATVPGSQGMFAAVVFLEGLPRHARLVAGAWPRRVPPDRPAEVVLPERAAATLGVHAGDRVPLHDRRTGTDAPVVVTGVYRPLATDDPYWQLVADPLAAGQYGPLVVDRTEFVARYLEVSTVDWVLVPDPDTLATTDLRPVARAVAGLRGTGLSGPGGAWYPVVRTDLDRLAGWLATTRTVGRSGLLLPVLLVLVVAGYVLYLIARLAADQRTGELALLRARGASRRQLARLAGGEAVLVVAPAALLGAPLAALVLRQGVPAPAGWLVAILAAAFCAAALVLPALRPPARSARRARWSALQRSGADAALVVLALLTWVQLRQYGGPLSGLDVDPLLVASPVLGVVAATAVSLRLLPGLTTLGVAATRRGTSFGRLLGLWRADRRPHAGPVLLMVLAVAAAALASCVAATWQRSQRDQADHQAGADLRAVLATGGSARLSTVDFAVPDVRAASAAVRLTGGTEVVALDAAAAPRIVRLRPDLAPPDAFARLVAARPVPSGAPLPAGTRRLAGRVSFAAGGGGPRPEPVALTAVVDDGTGTLAELPLGRVAPDGSLDVDVPVPGALPGGPPPRLVALTVTAGALALPANGSVPFTGRLTVRWALPLVGPGSWTVRAPAGAPPARFDGSTLTVDVPPGQDGFAARYVLSALNAAPAPVPALVTPQLLASTGARVGDVIPAGDGDRGFRARIVGTVAAVPSATADAAMLVDLPTLDAQRLLADRPFDPPTEWWLATEPSAHARVASLLGARSEYTLVDRDAIADRLLADPLGRGVLRALYAAVLSATVLAALGLVVDARASSLRSAGELAVLYTLGTPPRTLAGALAVEQAVLAALGVLGGLGAGLGVAAAMGPSMVLTGQGGRPVPAVALVVPVGQVAVPALVLCAVAVTLGAAIARRARRDVAAGLLRIGADT